MSASFKPGKKIHRFRPGRIIVAIATSSRKIGGQRDHFLSPIEIQSLTNHPLQKVLDAKMAADLAQEKADGLHA